MRLDFLDWSIIALYFAFNVAVGLYYKRRAGRSTAEFFLSGRNVPWWLAGTSMVATTFAADTPLVVTGLVAKNGIAGNWLWLNLLAVVAVNAVGGIEAMKTKLVAAGRGAALGFVPEIGSVWMPMVTFFVYIAVNWWATWYPGAEPGGGGYVAQRMLSAKDERHSLLATLWFNIAHYAVRPWPWILAALASLILFPGLKDPETGYIRVMIDYLPSSVRGLMIAAFAAAFMSTIATQLHWGASYLVNDFYRLFVRLVAGEPHYVLASRLATALLTVISAAVAFRIESIGGAWKLLIITGAGTGAVLLLRWYWWRINAWSEVSAMITAFVVSVLLQTVGGLDSDRPLDFARIVLVTVAVTTVVWLVVTFATRPETDATLVAFYRRTRPSRLGWGPVAARAPDVRPSTDGLANLVDWVAGCVLVYGALFGVGKLLLHDPLPGILMLGLSAIAGAVIYRDLSRRGWRTVVE